MYCLYFAGTMSVFLPGLIWHVSTSGGGGGLERFESKSSAMSKVTSPMNKYMDCTEYILLIYCLIYLFESLCLLAAFDTSDFFVVPVK